MVYLIVQEIEESKTKPEIDINDVNVNYVSNRDKIKAAKRKAKEALKATTTEVKSH